MSPWLGIPPQAKALPRQKAKPSPGWFELSRDVLQPAIEHKRELLKDYYRKGKVETKAELDETRRKVAELVDAAKIRWLEKKVVELENKYDPRGAWKAMREISSMFAGHIKSAVTIRMRKADGTMAANEAESSEVFRSHFEGVFNAPATAQDGIEEVVTLRKAACDSRSTRRTTIKRWLLSLDSIFSGPLLGGMFGAHDMWFFGQRKRWKSAHLLDFWVCNPRHEMCSFSFGTNIYFISHLPMNLQFPSRPASKIEACLPFRKFRGQ